MSISGNINMISRTSQRIFSRCVQLYSKSSGCDVLLPQIERSSGKFNGRLFPFSQQCRCYQTEGDRDLVQFLQEEIAYEEENVVSEPSFQDFAVDVNGTKVNFSRDFKGERVDVTFDINENNNVDEGLKVEEGDNQYQEEVDLPEIISYPHFEVKITKGSGRTLHFNASYNKLSEEEDDASNEEDTDEQFDLIRFDSLKIYDEHSQNKNNVYESDTENMDGELYSMLMTTLLERGITGAFVNDLLDYSTSLEHKQYVNFLAELKEFANEK